MQFLAVQFKRAFCAGFVSLAVLSIPSASMAVTVDGVPNPRRANGGWVTDMADVLAPATEAQLNQMISDLEARNGSEIAVVTVRDTAPSATSKQFATALFNRWRIGKAGKNNGVLLLISKGDRRIEIETGYGVEPILPDAYVGNIIRQEIKPRFKRGDYNGGTLAGTKAVIVALQAYNPPATQGINQPSSAQMPWYAWIPVAFIVGGVLIFVLFIAAFVIIVFRIIRFISSRISGGNSSYPSVASPSSCSSNRVSYSNSTFVVYEGDTADAAATLDTYDSDGSSCITYEDDNSSTSYNSDASDFGGGSSGGDGAGDSYASSGTSYDSSSYDSSSSSYDSSSSSYDSSSSSSYDSSSSSSYDSSSSSSYDSSSSSSYDSSSSSSYDSSSSSSDFGGGSSGGGGRGDSW
jgi:uncharacterized protein